MAHYLASHEMYGGRAPARMKGREAHDLAPIFWSIATPACLLFWALVAYGIHSAL
jgi:hypothetical protein